MSATLVTRLHVNCPHCKAEMAVPFRVEIVGRHGPDTARRIGACDVCRCNGYRKDVHDRMLESASAMARSFAESGP